MIMKRIKGSFERCYATEILCVLHQNDTKPQNWRISPRWHPRIPPLGRPPSPEFSRYVITTPFQACLSNHIHLTDGPPPLTKILQMAHLLASLHLDRSASWCFLNLTPWAGRLAASGEGMEVVNTEQVEQGGGGGGVTFGKVVSWGGGGGVARWAHLAHLPHLLLLVWLSDL